MPVGGLVGRGSSCCLELGERKRIRRWKRQMLLGSPRKARWKPRRLKNCGKKGLPDLKMTALGWSRARVKLPQDQPVKW